MDPACHADLRASAAAPAKARAAAERRAREAAGGESVAKGLGIAESIESASK